MVESKRKTKGPVDPIVQALFPRLAKVMPRFITPNMVTIAGLAATLTASVLLVLSRNDSRLLFIVAALVLVNWITDMLDGILARQRNQCSRLGDYLDHIFDAVTCVAMILGVAFSGQGTPALILTVGMVFMLGFAITYKGEHVTGADELLTFGPTEIRFALVGVLLGCYFVTSPIFIMYGHEVRFLDVAAAGSMLWALFSVIAIAVRYGRRVVEIEA